MNLETEGQQSAYMPKHEILSHHVKAKVNQ